MVAGLRDSGIETLVTSIPRSGQSTLGKTSERTGSDCLFDHKNWLSGSAGEMAFADLIRKGLSSPHPGQFCPIKASVVQNTVVMAFTKSPSGAVVGSPAGRSAGRDSDPW